MLDVPHAVRLSRSREIFVDVFPGHIFDAEMTTDERVELKSSTMCREDQEPLLFYAIHGFFDEFPVITLDVKCAVHAFRIGKRGWVEQDNVVSIFLIFNPVRAISSDQLMFGCVQAV